MEGQKRMESNNMAFSTITDLTANPTTSAGGRCAILEKGWLNCASKLGYNRAMRECEDAYTDFKECERMDLAFKRYQRMQEERQRKGLPYQEPPPLDTLAYRKFKNVVF